MPTYGYARCSTKDKQDIRRQLRDLTALGADEIFQECASGALQDRPEFAKLLAKIKKGDTVAATEVSRLSRSLHQLCHIAEDAETHGVRLVCGSIVLDYTAEKVDPMHVAMFKIMGVFAELERGLTVERIKSGLHNAKEQGARMGRPRKTAEDIPQKVLELLPEYRAGKFTKIEFAKRAGIARSALYKYLGLLDAGDVHEGQAKKTAEDIPQTVISLLSDFKAGNLKKSEFAAIAGISRPTLDKYLNLLGEG